MKDQFDPFLQFWTTAGNWKKWQKSWTYDAFETLNAEEIEKNVSNAWKTMFKMGKAFQLRDFNKCADNCEKIRIEIEEFKQYTPLISAMRSPGMRDRHWEKLSADIGIDVQPTEEYTLESILKMGLMKHLDAISKFRTWRARNTPSRPPWTRCRPSGPIRCCWCWNTGRRARTS